MHQRFWLSTRFFFFFFWLFRLFGQQFRENEFIPTHTFVEKRWLTLFSSAAQPLFVAERTKQTLFRSSKSAGCRLFTQTSHVNDDKSVFTLCYIEPNGSPFPPPLKKKIESHSNDLGIYVIKVHSFWGYKQERESEIWCSCYLNICIVYYNEQNRRTTLLTFMVSRFIRFEICILYTQTDIYYMHYILYTNYTDHYCL